MLAAVGQTVEVLFDTATGQIWKQGQVVHVGPNEDTGVLTYWVRLRWPDTDAMATLPYTRDDFLVGMVRVARVTRQRG